MHSFLLQRFASTSSAQSLHHSRTSILGRQFKLFMMSTSSSTPVAASIQEKLTKEFQPTHLDVINESHMHNVPANSETHFKVVVISPKFDTIKTPIQRHRAIHSVLESELAGPVHALSIVAKNPSQWEKMMAEGKTIESSPNCRGGDGSLPPKRATS
jgi:stress-induced morphogen